MGTIAWSDHAVNRSSDLANAAWCSTTARLANANARLEALRQQHRPNHTAPQLSAAEDAAFRPNHAWLANLQQRLENQPQDGTKTPPSAVSESPNSVRILPDLLVGMLKQEQVAAGRVWLLARALDKNGRGWIAVADLRAALSAKHAPLRLCGWRRLRQILQSGQGLFWQRDAFGRIWLSAQTKVAVRLGVTRFSSHPVAIATEQLLGTIGEVRAFFYKGFHFGRKTTPIARETLRNATGIAERTQRLYDQRTAIEAIRNFALQEKAGDSAWQHGHAAFDLTDTRGKHGEIGRTYTAIRLPNSYRISQPTTVGSKKRYNQQLKQALAHSGTQGNSTSYRAQRYFADGKQLAKQADHGGYLQTSTTAHNTFWCSFFVDGGRK